MKKFEFGINWKDFSDSSLSEEKYKEAKSSLKKLFQDIPFQGKRFLDVGCGSGIFSLSAIDLGAAEVVGIDCDQSSVIASSENSKKIMNSGEEESQRLSFFKKDILNESDIQSLGRFDLVYAWGSLHHTGDMYKALENCAKLVSPGGYLAVAIYNRHFTSPVWRIIKRTYVSSPKWLQKIWIWIFYPLIYCAKFCVTRSNPHDMKRGMNFYHDVVDWVGGYPYQYASAAEIIEFMRVKGFESVSLNSAGVPTGCNEFLFRH
ncbi:MAG: class I SAM-dependent methyltransferase [Candidatus Omnitrophica bacterium]|nr:class I SAM-dependent methyltransferase [Candidatus Omnitrophota bacterium]